jgi:ACT domain-containing protein
MSILNYFNETTTTIILTISTNLITYFATKNTNKKDVIISDKELTMSERQLLSEDEKSFRAELREELEGAKTEIREMRKEIGILHEANIKLMIENKHLQVTVEELTTELKKFNGDKR